MRDKTIEEIKKIKAEAEKQIFDILIKLEKETGLIYMSMDKKTIYGGFLDPWYTMEINLKF